MTVVDAGGAAPRVWVVGSVNVDYTMYVDELPRPGETILGHRLIVHAGGKGANQAVACAALGVPTSLVACVGHDAIERAVLEDIRAFGVDISSVDVSDTATGTALVIVDREGNNTISVFPGANYNVVRDAAFARGDTVLLQCEIPIPVIASVVKRARSCGCFVVLNAAPATTLPAEVMSLVDLLVVNEVEATASLGVSTQLMLAVARGDGDALAALHLAAVDSRAGAVVVTLGSLGSVLFSGTDVSTQKAFQVHAVDTVGAGDEFVAALVARRFEGFDVSDAMSWASAAAALVVAKPGTFEAFPSREEVDGFLRKEQ